MIIERIYNAINDAAKVVYNAIAWLTVDNTIIVAADKYHRGMEFVKLELLWGLYLSNPVYDVFTTSPTFNNIAQIAPAQVWGIVLLLLATLVMYGYYSNRNAFKSAGMLAIGIYWLIVAAAFITANPFSTSSIIYPWLAYCNIAWAAQIQAEVKTGGRGKCV